MVFSKYRNLACWLSASQNESDDGRRSPELAILALRDLDRLLACNDIEAYLEFAAMKARYCERAAQSDEGDVSAVHPHQTD